MTKHKTVMEAFGEEPEALAEKLGDLRYDALADLLSKLSKKVERDAGRDFDHGRVKLSEELLSLSTRLRVSGAAATTAWAICEPHS